MQTTCAVLTPRVVWCRARAPAGLAKLSQLLALSPWHLIAHGRSESSSKEQISARAFISEIRAAYRPAGLIQVGNFQLLDWQCWLFRYKGYHITPAPLGPYLGPSERFPPEKAPEFF